MSQWFWSMNEAADANQSMQAQFQYSAWTNAVHMHNAKHKQIEINSVYHFVAESIVLVLILDFM